MICGMIREFEFYTENHRFGNKIKVTRSTPEIDPTNLRKSTPAKALADANGILAAVDWQNSISIRGTTQLSDARWGFEP